MVKYNTLEKIFESKSYLQLKSLIDLCELYPLPKNDFLQKTKKILALKEGKAKIERLKARKLIDYNIIGGKKNGKII